MSLIGNNLLGLNGQGAMGRRARGTPILGSPSFVAMGTAYTVEMGPDGFNWAQGGQDGPIVWDAWGKLIAISENAAGSHTITYSNDGGATWTDSALNLGFLTRGSVAYNAADDRLEVCWLAAAASDGILYRQYAPTRDGSHTITGWSVTHSGYAVLDAETTGTMQYEHPCVSWLSDAAYGAHGAVVCAWCARNTGTGGTGNEIRAVLRVLSGTPATDHTPANWTHLGVASGTTIGNAPGAAGYTALLANTTTGIPHVAFARLLSGDLVIAYHDGTVTGGRMAGAWAFRRATWDGTSAWTALTAPATIANVVRAGADTGSIQKGELLTKPVQGAAGSVYLGIACWKNNTDGDTWTVAHITAGGGVTLIDVYSAGGAHSYAPVGDVTYDALARRLVVSYSKTATQHAYGQTYSGVTLAQSEFLIFDSAPVDIPLIRSRYGVDKLAVLFRDTNTPKVGHFGTLTWSNT